MEGDYEGTPGRLVFMFGFLFVCNCLFVVLFLFFVCFCLFFCLLFVVFFCAVGGGRECSEINNFLSVVSKKNTLQKTKQNIKAKTNNKKTQKIFCFREAIQLNPPLDSAAGYVSR